MTLIPVILSCVLSLIAEKATCESRKASCNLEPRTREVTANKGAVIKQLMLSANRQIEPLR